VSSENDSKSRVWLGATLLFIAVFLGELGFGIYLAYYRDFVYYDAVSRVANAFYVLYSRDPHLGSIGFVWNPLPSLLELVPLLFWRLIPAVATAGLASGIITSLFAAGTVSMLYANLRKRSGSVLLALAISLGFAFNPFIFLYGANGMSEAMFVFFIVWMVISFTNWMQEDRSGYPIEMGFALAMAFWVRYEAISLGAALALSIALIAIGKPIKGFDLVRNNELSRKLSRNRGSKMESTLIVALTPAFFSGFAWIALNYFIMGDPLFFFRSGYSNMAFSGNLTDEFRQLISTPAGVLWLVARKSVYFSLPLLTILISRLFTRRLFRRDTVVLIMLSASIPAMQFYLLLNGSSFGWLRFFVYSFVVAIAWLPYEFAELKRRARSYKPTTLLIIVSILISGFVIRDMNNHELSPDEYETFHIENSGTYKDLRMAREVSNYLNDKMRAVEPGARPVILTDSYSAYAVLLNSEFPKQWIITNDRDFNEALLEPQNYNVHYILVSKQIGSVLQIIHEVYPRLFHDGADWVELERDFYGEWRLFKVLRNPEQ